MMQKIYADFLGNTLNLYDKVVYTTTFHSTNLVVGYIVGFTPKKIEVLWEEQIPEGTIDLKRALVNKDLPTDLVTQYQIFKIN